MVAAAPCIASTRPLLLVSNQDRDLARKIVHVRTVCILPLLKSSVRGNHGKNPLAFVGIRNPKFSCRWRLLDSKATRDGFGPRCLPGFLKNWSRDRSVCGRNNPETEIPISRKHPTPQRHSTAVALSMFCIDKCVPAKCCILRFRIFSTGGPTHFKMCSARPPVLLVQVRANIENTLG